MGTQNTQIYVELYNYTQTWFDLPKDDRHHFVGVVEGAIAEMEAAGVNVIGFGFNDPNTDRRAPYDFFCVYTMPDVAFARTFESQVGASGWYNYFDQINISGPTQSVADALANNVDTKNPSAQ